MLAQCLSENPLALIGVGVNETAAEVGQQDIAFLQHRKTQQLQRLAQHSRSSTSYCKDAASAGKSARPSYGSFAMVSIRPDMILVPTRGSAVASGETGTAVAAFGPTGGRPVMLPSQLAPT